ncbi:hypothetical protein [Anaerosporobacter sp.]
MARGMNLDEFRSALSSDATMENEGLKKELSELKESTSKQIKELTEDRDTYKDQCRALGNRCYVFTQGNMCLNCSVEACEHLPSASDIMAAIEYMTKNKMPRNEDTRDNMNNFIMRRSSNK